VSGGRVGLTVVTAHMPVAGPESRLEYYELVGKDASLVALSEQQRTLAPHLPWIATVPNGIRVEDYPLRGEKDDFVLYLGRISRNKGVHRAVEAAAAAGQRLVIAGRGTIPSENCYFETEIAPLLGPDVEWVGEVAGKAKTDLLSRATCWIFPVQWNEPFGMVLLEAMACGTPVVALAEGATPEVVEDGRTGILCPDPEGLPDGIQRARELNPLECRALVARRFSAELMTTRYEDVYRQLLT
jgi:glycosyltransferase involved in cell wall biosynthesis